MSWIVKQVFLCVLCAPPPMKRHFILLAVLGVDSDYPSTACHVASCRAPDSAAFGHQDASQPCEASFAVCESCSGWRVAQKPWDPPRSIQFESSTSCAAKLSLPRWLLQCKSVYHMAPACGFCMLFHVFCLYAIHHSSWPRTAYQMLPSSVSLCWCMFRQFQV